MMMYLSWDAASLTCCQNHGGHTWSQHPSSIFTGMNHTGKVRAVWNRFQTQHAVCVNGLFATSPLCHDPAAWALHYPSIWKWLRAGASSTNSPPPPKINSLLFSFHQLSPITLLDIKNFPSKKKKPKPKPHQAKPCQGNKENVWIQPFSRCQGSLPGASKGCMYTVNTLLDGLELKEWCGGWCSCGSFFSQVRDRGPGTEVRSPVPRQGYNQGIHVGTALDFSLCVASQQRKFELLWSILGFGLSLK